MNSPNHEKVKFTTIAILILCVVVGCYAKTSTPVQTTKLVPPAELLNFTRLRPPMVIRLERTADWDGPQSIPEPSVSFELVVSPPTLAHMSDEPTVDVARVASPELRAENENDDVVRAVPVEEYVTATFEPGKLVQSTWTAGEALHGAQIPTPVLVAQGATDGPTLCVTAAIHGDEINGIESVRRFMYAINPAKLTGKVVGVPIVNLQGFQRHSRYLSDRRDLNRFFPGNPRGSSASRMAHSFFNDVIMGCDGLVDLHTGSFHRTNLPQLRADLHNPEVLALTQGFGATVILHSAGGTGTLRRAAADAGIPAVTLEAGEPLRLDTDAVEHTVKALFTLLDTLQMYNKRSFWGNPEPTYYSSSWVRADQGGILLSNVKLGKKVRTGDLLGTVTDPISNEQVDITAPYPGRIIGMALDQFVMPGFATFHLATQGTLDEPGLEEHYQVEGRDIAGTELHAAAESE